MRLLLPLPAILMLSMPALGQDADMDGVINAADAFPCDTALSAQAFAPAEDTHGMILVEDQWPEVPDTDSNDLVATYNYVFDLDAQGRAHHIRLTVNVLAIGGIYTNGLALTLPIAKGDVSHASLTIENQAAQPLTPSATDAQYTVVLQRSLRHLFGNAAGTINSSPSKPAAAGVVMVLDVALSVPSVLDPAAAPYDLFLFRTGDPSHEIHQPRYAGSSLMNAGLFGTLQDGSTPGRHFVDSQGLPAFLLLPQATPYPSEGTPISSLFPNISTFAASGGASAQDFFTSSVQLSAEYRDSAGLKGPTPRITARVADSSCVALSDADGDGFIAANDCDDLNSNVFPGNPEVCDGLDNDCNQLVDDGVTGQFATYYLDADQDGFGDGTQSLSACAQPPGYVRGTAGCTNGASNDCNVSGTTLIPTSAYIHPSPPAGWRQCAGFINTAGDDVAPNFLDNCLGQSGLRVIVTNLSTGQVEEDVFATGMSALTSWPGFSYLGGSLSAATRTYWGTTTFFATTDGRDACGHSVSANGGPTFGSGNGSRAIIVGHGTGANEYRVNCGGQSLANRSIVIFAEDASAGVFTPDCDDNDPLNFPSNTEVCDGQDNNCDGAVDEGLLQTFYLDQDNDGYGQQGAAVQACSAPAGYAAGGSLCTNGSLSDCNAPGTTLLSASRYVDPAPPAGWKQCAGFLNTASDDVSGNFLDNCLGQTSLRVIVTNTATGQVEEDIESTNLSGLTSWPSFAYLGGSITAHTRTYWGTTTFFSTVDGRDACGHSVSGGGEPTFGSGNGSRAIIVGYGTGANEYRVNCGGQSLAGRTVAIYTQSTSSAAAFDCDDTSATVYPGATEMCNGVDDNCDAAVDENNPGGNVACGTGLAGICAQGATQCISGALACVAVQADPIEICGDGTDNNCDGQIDEPMCSTVVCSNGSGADCNPPGTSLITSSRYVDLTPPSGWTQCAGFINTSANDVTGRFIDNCLGSNRLRVIVTKTATGQVEEDIESTNLSGLTSWPSFAYLGGSITAHTRTYWGTTTFFSTVDGRDACGHSVSGGGEPTFGSGNGSRAIIVGYGTNGNEYRVNCGGQSLEGRSVALYR